MRRLAFAVLAAQLLAAPAAAAPGDNALEDVRFLSSDAMQGRLTGSDGAAEARLYILGRLREIGLEPTDQTFTFKRKTGEAVTGTNLMARIPGTAGGGKALVVTAHYDHLGVQGGQVFNGADDNASGVAALLAVAEAFIARPPRHDVWIVFLDGEEMGLQGAKAFVANPPVPLSRIGLNVNLDMLGKNDRGELYASGGAADPGVKARLQALVPIVPVTLKLGHDTDIDGPGNNWTYQSDHGAFARAGVRWVYFGVEDHPEYHRPTDDFATIPRDFFNRAVATVIIACARFDEDLDALATEAGR